MPEFLDGIEQGGGLTTVADVTVSGGAVTEMSSGAITLVDGGVYEFSGVIEQSGAGTNALAWLIDSDDTDTYYSQMNVVYSRPAPQSDNTFQVSTFWDYTFGLSSVAGQKTNSTLSVSVLGTQLNCQFWGTRPNQANSAEVRYVVGNFLYDSGTLPSEVGVVSLLASGIANGSTLKGVRLY